VTPLASAADAYLKMRRALGFKLHHLTWWLPDFVAFVESHGSPTITAALAVRWAQQPPDADPSWWAKRLSAVRGFAKHYRAYDPRTEIPECPFPCRRVRQPPHIYSDAQISTLLALARQLRDRTLSESYTTLLALLAATGMRVGEALALDDTDVDIKRSLIIVRCGKFGKSRLVPVHPTASAALQRYVRRRNRLCPCRQGTSFFVSSAGRRVIHQNLHHVFLRLLAQAGIRGPAGRRARLHDLRHAFAVKTVGDWYRAGVDVEARVPWLSTYLGHVGPSSTYWYLSATPELLDLAGTRLERFWKTQP
jgi:site-specific recombinase XerD